MRFAPPAPRIIAPAPLIFLCAFVSGLVLDAMADFPGIAIWWPVRWLIGLGMIACGLRIGRAALAASRQAGVRAAPWKPTTALVTAGIYARSRNPLYLAIALSQLGVVLLLDSIFGVITLVPAMILLRYGVIDREERYLRDRYGHRYRDYAGKVRRWV